MGLGYGLALVLFNRHGICGKRFETLEAKSEIPLHRHTTAGPTALPTLARRFVKIGGIAAKMTTPLLDER